MNSIYTITRLLAHKELFVSKKYDYMKRGPMFVETPSKSVLQLYIRNGRFALSSTQYKGEVSI